MLGVFMVAGFSFQGTEIVGIASAETENPEKNVPKAIRSVFWRILLFYIGSIFIAGTLVPFTSPELLGGGVENVAASPMVIIFEQAGFAAAASVLNAVILTSVLSCGNSGLYTGSRMLQSMATRGNAPKVFAKLNKRGVPVAAVWATGLIATLSFLSSLVGEQKIFWLLLNASAISGFVIWWGISICHLRFRKAWLAQGHSVDEFKFRSRFYPFGNWFALVVVTVVIFGCNMWVFDPFSLFDFVTSYILIPVIPILYLVVKKVKGTKIVPLTECDFTPPANLVDDMPDQATLAR
jgi:lysine-specific permease